MSAWWTSREPRERWLLSVLGALVALIFIVFALVLPAVDARQNAQDELTAAKTDLALITRAAPNLGVGMTTGAKQPFQRSVLIQTARSRGIQLTRVQPGQDGTIAVWIDDAQTDALYGFFDDMLNGYAVSLERAVVDSDGNGRLSAQFTVRG